MKQSCPQNVLSDPRPRGTHPFSSPPSHMNAMFESNSTPAATRRRSLLGPVSALALGLLAACGGGSSAKETPAAEVGATKTHADGTLWFVDANKGGDATGIFIEEVYWGRLVDVYDSTGKLYHKDFLIGEDIQSDGVNFQIDINPVTEAVSLNILHAYGTVGYDLAFASTTANLGPILTKGVENALPPFSFVPRNAAIGVHFSDLIDPQTLNSNTLKVQTGNPPSEPFEVRLLPDQNYGGSKGGTFYPTRAIIDTTISELDAAGGLFVLNSLGLPKSKSTALPNVGLRIPTQENFAVGQFQILENLSGHGLSPANNGPVDFASQTVDVVRGMRSGGDTVVTGDSNNGFLLDLNSPLLLGAQPVTITGVVADPASGPDRFLIGLKYASLTCGVNPLQPGDVVKLPGGLFCEVVLQTAAPNLGVIGDVNIRLLSGDAQDLHAGPAQVLTTYGPDSVGLEPCFFSFSPLAGVLPSSQVTTDAQVVVRFSEPMDPASLQPFDSFTVTRTQFLPGISDFVIGEVTASADLKEFRFVPRLPFAHAFGGSETYYANLISGNGGITDLAGNQPTLLPNQISFTLKSSDASESNGGIVLPFNNPDEDGDTPDGVDYTLSEYMGQFLLVPEGGAIRPRPVDRVAAIGDPKGAVVGKMINFAPGVQTPLSPLGSRMMTVYRHCDVNLSLTDNTQFNMDVEGVNWAPVDGQVQADIYENFEVNLSHSLRLPDEHVNTALLPTKTQSGLGVNSFAMNILLDVEGGVEQVTMHDQGLGYIIDPVDVFVGGSGTAFIPYPINKDKPESEFSFYTWRDTSIQIRGGPNSNGIPLEIENDLGVAPFGFAPGTLARPGAVPSLGLPLLLEVKCYPSDKGIGLNALSCAIAINSSSLPTFRIFSTGGFDEAGLPQVKNPDSEVAPTGGYNANPALPQPLGSPTKERDNVFYYGQLDLVVRVSRVVTRWFDTGDENPDYLEPVIEPRAEDQPTGTSLTVAYRGALDALAPTKTEDEDPSLSADSLNIYGDQPPDLGNELYGSAPLANPDILFLNNNQRWLNSLDDIDGARFFQARFTFVGNTVSGLTPTLSAFGVAFESLN